MSFHTMTVRSVSELFTAATVSETDRQAVCALTFSDGTSRICTKKALSHSEMAEWDRHHETFFGVRGPRIARAETPLQMYDFIVGEFQSLKP